MNTSNTRFNVLRVEKVGYISVLMNTSNWNKKKKLERNVGYISDLINTSNTINKDNELTLIKLLFQ